MNRSGQYVEVALNMGTLFIGFLVLGIAALLPGIVDAKMAENTFTLRATSHSNAIDAHLRRGYVDDSVGWTMHAATVTQGQLGGGQERWTVDTIPPEDDIEAWLEAEATRVFLEDYLGGPFPNSLCEISVGGEMTVRERLAGNRRPGIRYNYRPEGNPPTANCTAVTGSAQVPVPVQRRHHARGNRYFPLYRNVTAALEDIAEAWGNEVEDTYDGTGSSQCGGTAEDARTNAEDDAHETAKSDIESIRDDALSEHPEADLFRVSEKAVSLDSTTTITTQPDEFDCCAEYNSSTSPRHCIDEDTYWSGAEAEATPQSVDMRFGMEDIRYGIPTADGNQSLEFVVPTFAYSFE